MNDNSPKQNESANNCFVCGPQNPIGLHVSFTLENEKCVGEFTPLDNHVGFDGVTHGGIIYSLLDDAMANWFFLRGDKGFTARAEIRYRQPLEIGKKVKIECGLVYRKGRLMRLRSTIFDLFTKNNYAEAEGSFMLEKREQRYELHQ